MSQRTANPHPTSAVFYTYQPQQGTEQLKSAGKMKINYVVQMIRFTYSQWQREKKKKKRQTTVHEKREQVLVD